MFKSFIVLLVILPALVCAEQYIVIVSPDSEISEITKTEIKRIYKGDLKRCNGTLVVPVNLAYDHPTTKIFLKDIVGKSPDRFKKIWVKNTIKGLGSAPMIQPSPSEMKEYISNKKNAVGYIPESELDDSVKKLDL